MVERVAAVLYVALVIARLVGLTNARIADDTATGRRQPANSKADQ
jgi:hypothetical protein